MEKPISIIGESIGHAAIAGHAVAQQPRRKSIMTTAAVIATYATLRRSAISYELVQASQYDLPLLERQGYCRRQRSQNDEAGLLPRTACPRTNARLGYPTGAQTPRPRTTNSPTPRKNGLSLRCGRRRQNEQLSQQETTKVRDIAIAYQLST